MSASVSDLCFLITLLIDLLMFQFVVMKLREERRGEALSRSCDLVFYLVLASVSAFPLVRVIVQAQF